MPEVGLVADRSREEPGRARGGIPGGHSVVGEAPGEALQRPLGGGGGVLGAQGRPDEALEGCQWAAGQDGQGDGGERAGDDEPHHVLLVVEGAQAQEDLGEGIGVATAPSRADEGAPCLPALLGAERVEAGAG